MAKTRKITLKGKPKLQFKPTEFQKFLLDSITEQIDAKIKASITNIRKDVREYVGNIIHQSFTAKALQDGNVLAYAFGIPKGDAQTYINEIVLRVIKSVNVRRVRVRRSGKNIVGGIKIGIILSDYSDVLALKSARILTDKKDTLEWLKWLLLEEGKIIVTTHRVMYKASPASRSGGAIMIKDKSYGFRVPPLYQGNEDDNWFTREFIDSNEAKFLSFLNGLIAKYI